MKILALSDIHGDRTFIREMAQKGASEKVDLVILAGDIVEMDGSLDGMVGPFKENGLKVAVLPGNHEGLDKIGILVDLYGVKNLHGNSMKHGDIGIFGCGYADVGPHQLTEEQFFATLQKTHDEIKDCKTKIMVTHIQPKNSVLSLGMKEWGSSGVDRAIAQFQPDLHICGHIHETHGIEEMIGKTKVVNVGKSGRIFEF